MNDTSRGIWRWRLALALGLVLLGTGANWVVAYQLARFRQPGNLSLRQPLTSFPQRVGEWRSSPLEPSEKQLEYIDEHVYRRYEHTNGEVAVLWIAFSRRSADQWHYPTVCMKGSGWTEEETLRCQLELRPPLTPVAKDGQLQLDNNRVRDADNNSATEERVTVEDGVNAARMHFKRDGAQEYVHYWYYLLGEDEIDRTLRRLTKVHRFFLRGRRNASVTVEVFSQSHKPNQELLDAFARDVAEQMEFYLPKGTEAACDLGANF